MTVLMARLSIASSCPNQSFYYIQKRVSRNIYDRQTAVRQHWGIENQLHWTLDMTFRKDESRIRTEAAPENFAINKHIALNLIKNDTSRKASVKRKRFMAALEDDVRENIITFALTTD